MLPVATWPGHPTEDSGSLCLQVTSALENGDIDKACLGTWEGSFTRHWATSSWWLRRKVMILVTTQVPGRGRSDAPILGFFMSSLI